MQNGLKIQLLGSFQVQTTHGKNVMPRGAKTCAALAYLAFNLNMPIHRTRLIELFWHDRDLEQGQGSLRQALSEMRRKFSAEGLDVLRSNRKTVMLSLDHCTVDLWDDDRNIKIDIRDRLLDDMPEISSTFNDWLVDTRRFILSSQLLVAERALAAVDMATNPARVTELASHIMALDPCNEPAARTLMTALAQQDKLSAAKFAYEGLATALKADGFEVSPATTQLYHALRNSAEPARPAQANAATTTVSIPIVRVETLDNYATNLTFASITESLADSCLERLVQLPELCVQDARLLDAAATPGFALGCKITGAVDQPVCHLHLTDLDNAEIIWSTRQRVDPDNLYHDLAVVADITATAVLMAVERLEQKRLAARTEDPQTPYQHYLDAKRMFFEAREPDYIKKVEDRLERAIALDPSFEPAYIHLIQSYNNARFLSEPGRDLTLDRDRAMMLARKLLGLNSFHPNSHIAMAWCQIWQRNFPMAERHFDRALALGAYEAHRLNAIGTGLIYLGRTDDGAACYEQAQERMLTEFEYQRTDNGELSYLRGDFEDALSWLETGERHAPYRGGFWQAVSFAQLDRQEEARAALERMTQTARPMWRGAETITPDHLVNWLLGTLPLQRKVDMDLVLDGIQKAGVTLAQPA